MDAALALAGRTRGRTAPNPNVGCVIVRDGAVVGRGWTQAGGRPHAEAVALAEAGGQARGATAYVTLEPCAHVSHRGPACADLLVDAGVARIVAALRDPDPRTNGSGLVRLRDAGIDVATGIGAEAAMLSMAGFLTRRRYGRPHVTLKLALSLDGAAAMADGRSQWITGPEARAHAHLERSRHEAILVGRGTWETDSPRLDVRLPGLEDRAPVKVVLSSTIASPIRHPSERWDLVEESAPTASRDPSFRRGDEQVETRGSASSTAQGSGTPAQGRGDESWVIHLPNPAAITTLLGDHLLIEGGAQTAAAFLAADLVDRLLLYRAPVVIGGGRTLPDIGLADLPAAHRRWTLADARALGSDRLEVYHRIRED